MVCRCGGTRRKSNPAKAFLRRLGRACSTWAVSLCVCADPSSSHVTPPDCLAVGAQLPSSREQNSSGQIRSEKLMHSIDPLDRFFSLESQTGQHTSSLGASEPS